MRQVALIGSHLEPKFSVKELDMSPVPPFVVPKPPKHVPQVGRINPVGKTRPKPAPPPQQPKKK